MFANNNYATVWKINSHERYLDVQLSTSRKNHETNQYETDFSGYVRFVGKAFEMGKNLRERDKVKLLSCGVSNHYDKDKNVTYNNFVVFDYDEAGAVGNNRSTGTQNNGSNTQRPDSNTFVKIPDGIASEELPFA
jgi:hypothetical protein